jgi:hypothetical protein
MSAISRGRPSVGVLPMPCGAAVVVRLAGGLIKALLLLCSLYYLWGRCLFEVGYKLKQINRKNKK